MSVSTSSSTVNSETVVDDNSSSNPRSRPTVTGAGVDTTPNATTTTPTSSPASTSTTLSAAKQAKVESNKPTKEKTLNDEKTGVTKEKLANSAKPRAAGAGANSTNTAEQGDSNEKNEPKVSPPTCLSIHIQLATHLSAISITL